MCKQKNMKRHEEQSGMLENETVTISSFRVDMNDFCVEMCSFLSSTSTGTGTNW